MSCDCQAVANCASSFPESLLCPLCSPNRDHNTHSTTFLSGMGRAVTDAQCCVRVSYYHSHDLAPMTTTYTPAGMTRTNGYSKASHLTKPKDLGYV